jgi:hypothetical protein
MKEWRDYPSAHKDITVSIYSKQTLNILNAAGTNYQEHYDGSLPTGFTDSTYRGMPLPVTDDVPATVEEPIVWAEATLTDVFSSAFEDGILLGGIALLGLCFGEAAAICFNPFNWF